MATTDTVWATPDTATDTVWATPDTATDTVWATVAATDTDTVWDTPDTATATDTAADTATTARGLLMPSPLLSPRLMLTMATTDAVWDTPDTDPATDTPATDTDMDAVTDTAPATATTARFPNCLPNNKSKQFYIKIFH